jgi:hypothetical protein
MPVPSVPASELRVSEALLPSTSMSSSHSAKRLPVTSAVPPSISSELTRGPVGGVLDQSQRVALARPVPRTDSSALAMV